MNYPSQRKYNAAGRRIAHPLPAQPTIISRSTARSIEYLEQHGLADFSSCKLSVFLGRGPRSQKYRNRGDYVTFPHKLAV